MGHAVRIELTIPEALAVQALAMLPDETREALARKHAHCEVRTRLITLARSLVAYQRGQDA